MSQSTWQVVHILPACIIKLQPSFSGLMCIIILSRIYTVGEVAEFFHCYDEGVDWVFVKNNYYFHRSGGLCVSPSISSSFLLCRYRRNWLHLCPH